MHAIPVKLRILLKSIKDVICIFMVSEWLLSDDNRAIFQLYHDKDMLILNEMMMRSALF